MVWSAPAAAEAIVVFFSPKGSAAWPNGGEWVQSFFISLSPHLFELIRNPTMEHAEKMLTETHYQRTHCPLYPGKIRQSWNQSIDPYYIPLKIFVKRILGFFVQKANFNLIFQHIS